MGLQLYVYFFCVGRSAGDPTRMSQSATPRPLDFVLSPGLPGPAGLAWSSQSSRCLPTIRDHRQAPPCFSFHFYFCRYILERITERITVLDRNAKMLREVDILKNIFLYFQNIISRLYLFIGTYANNFTVLNIKLQ